MNYRERADQVNRVVDDTLTTFPEKLEFIYHWMMLEYGFVQRRRVQRRIDKQATWLGNQCNVFNFRHELNDQ